MFRLLEFNFGSVRISLNDISAKSLLLSYVLLFVLSKAWADAFRNVPSLSGVVCVYDDLKKRGLEFPMTDLDALSPIHTPIRVNPFSE